MIHSKLVKKSLILMISLALTSSLFVGCSSKKNESMEKSAEPVVKVQISPPKEELLATPKPAVVDAISASTPLPYLLDSSGKKIDLSESNVVANNIVKKEEFLKDKSNLERVYFVGSQNVKEIIDTLLIQFKSTKKNNKINIEGANAATGIKRVYDETAEVAMAAREFTKEELEYKLNSFPIGYEGIAIVINVDNPVEEVSLEQVKKIFSGQIKNWKEIGGNDAPISVISYDNIDTSGKKIQAKMIMEEMLSLRSIERRGDVGQLKSLIKSGKVYNSSQGVMADIALDPNSIGYVDIMSADATVKALRIDGIELTEDSVRQRIYPLSRPLMLITRNTLRKEAKDFIDFILGKEGQTIVEGFYLPAKQY